jgi:hypothetical protein
VIRKSHTPILYLLPCLTGPEAEKGFTSDDWEPAERIGQAAWHQLNGTHPERYNNPTTFLDSQFVLWRKYE